MTKRARVCGKRCHEARRATCRCWCGGTFHGEAGRAAREEFTRDYNRAIPTTEDRFLAATSGTPLLGDELGDAWQTRVAANVAAR